MKISPKHEELTEEEYEEEDEEALNGDLPPVEDHSAIQGRYSIGEELGYGGFATVRLGTNLKTYEQVAVKIINRKSELALWVIVYTACMSELKHIISSGLADLDPEEDQDVRNEALIMRSLNHTNVVKLLDFIEADKFFYLVLGTAVD